MAEANIKVILFSIVLILNYVSSKATKKPVNVLLMLADDLGYGDTSVSPFEGSGIYTPELKKMAAKGTVMSNFHTAAATCTPTRASILTGMYPWRLGIKGVYEYGSNEKGMSNRNDWLPQTFTLPMLFKANNYSTFHSGKWHVGGMRNDDHDMRYFEGASSDSNIGLMGRKCRHPGPNQQGFDEYVSVLDGPGAPRQNFYQGSKTLHSRGCEILLHNDKPIGTPHKKDVYLSDCEVQHAIRMMTSAVEANKPFFQQVWFHAPHGPWEHLPGPWDSLYKDGSAEYPSMVSAMDRSIGVLLKAVKDLGIEKDTIIVFTSDNGPEDGRGSTGGFRGRKRFLYEGGIRVPCIWQWSGHIPKGVILDSFGMTTDLLPTFAHAAGLTIPTYAHLDGVSLLPILRTRHRHTVIVPRNVESEVDSRRLLLHNEFFSNNTFSSRHLVKLDGVAVQSRSNLFSPFKFTAKYLVETIDRIAFWHNDFEGPRLTVVRLYDFKIILGGDELPLEIFDLRQDPFEKNNLLTDDVKKVFLKNAKKSVDYNVIPGYSAREIDIEAMVQSDSIRNKFKNVILSELVTDRNNTLLPWLLLLKTYHMANNFAKYGNEPHRIYLGQHHGREYKPSVESDIRSYKVSNIYSAVSKTESLKNKKSHRSIECATPCSCEIIAAKSSIEYPFNHTRHLLKSMWPSEYPRAVTLLSSPFINV